MLLNYFLCVFLFLKSFKLMDLGDNVKRICMTSLQIGYWKSYRWIQKWFSQKYIFSKNSIEFKNFFLKLSFSNYFLYVHGGNPDITFTAICSNSVYLSFFTCVHETERLQSLHHKHMHKFMKAWIYLFSMCICVLLKYVYMVLYVQAHIYALIHPTWF